jgi:hypothetical protein
MHTKWEEWYFGRASHWEANPVMYIIPPLHVSHLSAPSNVNRYRLCKHDITAAFLFVCKSSFLQSSFLWVIFYLPQSGGARCWHMAAGLLTAQADKGLCLPLRRSTYIMQADVAISSQNAIPFVCTSPRKCNCQWLENQKCCMVPSIRPSCSLNNASVC